MKRKKARDQRATEIIDALGGTNVVAELCGIGASAVAQWRQNGIPRYRMMYLRLARKTIIRAIEERA